MMMMGAGLFGLLAIIFLLFWIAFKIGKDRSEDICDKLDEIKSELEQIKDRIEHKNE